MGFKKGVTGLTNPRFDPNQTSDQQSSMPLCSGDTKLLVGPINVDSRVPTPLPL